MKKLILFIGLTLPMLGLGQEKRKSAGITLCLGVGPVYCYYDHNIWIVTPGLLNDPEWDLKTMSIPKRKTPGPNIVYFKKFHEKQYNLVQKKTIPSLPTYQFNYDPKTLTLIDNK